MSRFVLYCLGWDSSFNSTIDGIVLSSVELESPTKMSILEGEHMLSVYRNAYDTTGTTGTFEAITERILDGKQGLGEKTRMCRILAATDPKAYRVYKEKQLPAVTFAGIFPKKQRKAEYLQIHSGDIVIDIDGLTHSQLVDLLAFFAQHPYVKLTFISPSGSGIKLVVSVTPVPTNDAEHKTAWHACVDFFQNEAEEYGFEIDPSGKDCSRLCFLVQDPQAIYNPNPQKITWDKSNVYLHTSDLSDYEHSEADTSNLHAFLKSQDVKILGKRDRGGSFVECLNRAEHTDGKQGKTDTFIRLCENGLIYHCSHAHCADKKSRWFFDQRGIHHDPFRKTATRYHIDKGHQHRTSEIDTEREANQSVLEKWLQDTDTAEGKHLLNFGSAAGTGKTTAATTTVNNLLYIGKTTEEADSVYEILNNLEQDCYRHRPRLYNRDHPDWNTLAIGLTENDRPCISPELCNIHAQRIGTPNAICSQCPAQNVCKDDGYLAQAKIEKNTSKVIYAETEKLACDEVFRGRVKHICRKDHVLIVDEVNPLELTQKRILTRDMLYDLTERFRHPHEKTITGYNTLKSLLDLISTAETPDHFLTGIAETLDAIDDIEALDKQIEQYPLGVIFHERRAEATHNRPLEATLCYQSQDVTVPIVNHETADDTPAFFIGENVPIEIEKYQIRFMPYSFLQKTGLSTLDNPPHRYTNLLKDLKKFLNENPNPETAPFAFDPKTQIFDFHLKPTLNHRRVIFNTASDPDNLIGEKYRNTGISITRHTGQTPAWKDPIVFQIATGKYLPRHSLISNDGGTLTLKPYAQQMIDQLITPSINIGLKTLVVAPKAFQEIEAVKTLDCQIINHHHAEGRNDFQDCDIVFIFHYEPDHNSIPIHAKHTFHNPEAPLSFDRDTRHITVGSVSFEKNVYTDSRVQAIYNRECRARLMQSAMRLRPNIHEGKIIVFLTAEPVDIPVNPVAFHPTDAKLFSGDWCQFMTDIQAQDTETDIQAVMEREGVSESTARRKTKDARARDTTKTDRDTEIFRRYAAGQSKKQIATELGIGQGTVKRVLDKHAS